MINHGVIIKDLPTADLSKAFVYEKYIDLIPLTEFKDFPELPEGIKYLTKDKNKITVAVNINKINTKGALKKLLDIFELKDIDVYDADLETVIRNIYEGD